jgi:uncharacterized protein YcgL (UPF0745 family)
MSQVQDPVVAFVVLVASLRRGDRATVRRQQQILRHQGFHLRVGRDAAVRLVENGPREGVRHGD